MKKLKLEEEIFFPTEYGPFYLKVYTADYTNEKKIKPIMVLKTKNLSSKPLLRVHSSCMFSEVFSSMLCDCREQLESSLKLISERKDGILIYLDQEGRGHGILAKTKELKIQETGVDTVDASKLIGLKPDSRQYDVVINILRAENINSVKLITNNPEKMNALQSGGIKVKRIALKSSPNEYNKKYLETKRSKLGHLL